MNAETGGHDELKRVVTMERNRRSRSRETRSCPFSAGDPSEIGVRGTGATCFYGVRCDDYRARFEAAERFRAELRKELAGWWSNDGFGARCTPGDRMSVRVSVHDSREIDEVIRRVGARLKAGGLGEEIVISVSGDPVAY